LHIERPRAWMRALIAASVMLAWWPSTATADPPTVTLAGDPKVGQPLTATVDLPGRPDKSAQWSWRRCAPEITDTASCPVIDRSTETQADTPTQSIYVLQTADAGMFIVAEVTVTEDDDDEPPEIFASNRLGPVSPIPSDPSTTPPVTPTPTGAVLGDVAPLRFITPFPVVRIKGVLTATGARVTLFTVRARRGARIAVRCRGTTCPRRRWARRADRLTHLRPYERELAARTRITVLVTAPRRIGKHTTIVIRRGIPPWRRDRCVMPGTSRPVRCPDLSA
jgi:hypothetical protein